jgi:hypothetical protein
MSTITIPRADVTCDEVCEALERGLGPRYQVRPDSQPALGAPRESGAETIAVTIGPTGMWRADVQIVRRGGGTEIHVTPAGIISRRMINTVGIARRVSRVLSDARGSLVSAGER